MSPEIRPYHRREFKEGVRTESAHYKRRVRTIARKAKAGCNLTVQLGSVESFADWVTQHDRTPADPLAIVNTNKDYLARSDGVGYTPATSKCKGSAKRNGKAALKVRAAIEAFDARADRLSRLRADLDASAPGGMAWLACKSSADKKRCASRVRAIRHAIERGDY